MASQPSHQLQTKPKAAAKRENGSPRLASADAAEHELLPLQPATKAAAAEEPALPGETSFVDKVCRPRIPFSRTFWRLLACEFLVVDALCLVEACLGMKLENAEKRVPSFRRCRKCWGVHFQCLVLRVSVCACSQGGVGRLRADRGERV